MGDFHIQNRTFMYMFHIYRGLFFVYVANSFSLQCICSDAKKYIMRIQTIENLHAH